MKFLISLNHLNSQSQPHILMKRWGNINLQVQKLLCKKKTTWLLAPLIDAEYFLRPRSGTSHRWFLWALKMIPLNWLDAKKKSSRVVKATRRRKLNLNSNRTEKEAIENNFIPIGLMPRVGPWRKEKKWMKFAVYYNNLFSLPLCRNLANNNDILLR